MISPDHEVRGHPFEVWIDGTTSSGGYPNWWLATDDPAVAAACGVDVKTVLGGDEFKPPLTHAEIERIGEMVLGYLTD